MVEEEEKRLTLGISHCKFCFGICISPCFVAVVCNLKRGIFWLMAAHLYSAIVTLHRK